MGKDFLIALITAGAWLLVWAVGVVIQEAMTGPWYRQEPGEESWEAPWWGRADE